MTEEAVVQNAADSKQVKAARKTEKQLRDEEKGDLKKMLSLPEGRRLLWRLLEQCHVYGSIMETSARIYYNAGQQDLGHWLLDEIMEADTAAYVQMQLEARARKETAHG